MGEVVWVDGWVDGWVGGYDVHASAGKGVFKDGEQGEVVIRVEGGVGAVEQTGVVGMLGDCTAW